MSLQIAPEIEARVRQEAAAHGLSVDSLLQEALALYREQRQATPARFVQGFEDSSRELAWSAKPDLAYLNQWVALDGDRVVAHGSDGKLVFESARAEGFASPFMLFVEKPDSTPFVSGWK